ncbi:hypothetical protein LCGC14_2994060 [marine sediment metagenome]|uniref:HNH nuclease domain-containing protein n=1 Tax=marine sediment metagenome TaxID=412755 RepID=A0A0F8X3F5_9ZZZZ
MEDKTWKTALQNASFEVSSEGEVRHKPPKVHYSKGYPAVCLPGQGGVSIHTLVLTAFVGPRPKGYCCHHKNGDRADNRLENLEWIPTRRHLLEHIKKRGFNLLTTGQVRQIRDIHKTGRWGRRRIGLFLNLNPYTVRSVLQGKSWVWFK